MSIPGWGWWSPLTSRKFHYFGENGRALCGKWLAFSNIHCRPDTGAENDSTDDCVACQRKVQKLRDTVDA